VPRSLSAQIHLLADLVGALERDGKVPASDVVAGCDTTQALAVLVALGLVAVPGNRPGSPDGSPSLQAPHRAPRKAPTASPQPTASEAQDGAALRRLRHRFARRLGRFATIPTGVTWEAASDPTGPWHALLQGDARRRIGTHRDAPAEGIGTVSGRPESASGRIGTPTPIGTHRDAIGTGTGTPPNPTNPGTSMHRDGIGTHRDASPSSPLTLPSSPEIPAKEEEGARERVCIGTPIGTLSHRDASGRIGTPSPAPLPMTERPLEVLARCSGGRVSALASTHDQMELAVQLTALGLVGEELESFGKALAGDGLQKLWPRSKAVAALGPRKAVTAGFFLTSSGNARMLADGVQRWREAQEEARALAARKAAPPPSRPFAALPDPKEAGARFRAILALKAVGAGAPAP